MTITIDELDRINNRLIRQFGPTLIEIASMYRVVFARLSADGMMPDVGTIFYFNKVINTTLKAIGVSREVFIQTIEAIDRAQVTIDYLNQLPDDDGI